MTGVQEVKGCLMTINWLCKYTKYSQQLVVCFFTLINLLWCVHHEVARHADTCLKSNYLRQMCNGAQANDSVAFAPKPRPNGESSSTVCEADCAAGGRTGIMEHSAKLTTKWNVAKRNASSRATALHSTCWSVCHPPKQGGVDGEDGACKTSAGWLRGEAGGGLGLGFWPGFARGRWADLHAAAPERSCGKRESLETKAPGRKLRAAPAKGKKKTNSERRCNADDEAFPRAAPSHYSS